MDLRPLEPLQPPTLFRLQLQLQRPSTTCSLGDEKRQNDAREEVDKRVEEQCARSEARGFGVESGIRWRNVRKRSFVQLTDERGCIKEDGKPAYPGTAVCENGIANSNGALAHKNWIIH